MKDKNKKLVFDNMVADTKGKEWSSVPKPEEIGIEVETPWINYLTLLDRIYNNDILLYNLKIIDENNKVWWWVKDIESFAMGMHDYEISAPYIYLTETYNDMELANLKVRIVPAVVEFIKEEDALSMRELMKEIQEMHLKGNDKIYVTDNMNNLWYYDNKTKNLLGTDNEPMFVMFDKDEECPEHYGENYEGDRFTTVHNDVEIASVRFKIVKEDKEKDKLKESLYKEIDICMNEIQARIGIIDELAKKLKECE